MEKEGKGLSRFPIKCLREIIFLSQIKPECRKIFVSDPDMSVCIFFHHKPPERSSLHPNILSNPEVIRNCLMTAFLGRK